MIVILSIILLSYCNEVFEWIILLNSLPLPRIMAVSLKQKSQRSMASQKLCSTGCIACAASGKCQSKGYADGSGYEARFTQCGICTLMKKLGLYDRTLAMCHLDYTMSEAGGASNFVREYTLASGGPYCDCGYQKRS